MKWKQHSLIWFAACALLASSGQAQSPPPREAPMQVDSTRFDAIREANSQSTLSESLLANEASGTLRGHRVEIDEAARRSLAEAPTHGGRIQVGVTLDLSAPVTFAEASSAIAAGPRAALGLPLAGGQLKLDPRGFSWHTWIEAKGAQAVRLHLTDVNLPEGVRLFVYTRSGEAFGPYTHASLVEDDQLWTHTVRGEQIRLQLQYAGRDSKRALSETHFDLQQVVHLGPNFILGGANDEPAGDRAFCSFNSSCIQNANCASMPSAIQTARNAIAHLQFVVGSSAFICSGGLLNDTDTSTTIPYFLTANHCFSSSSAASSLEAYFQFSASCGGACFNPNGAVPRVLGSSLLATSGTSDYTFLQLNQTPPSGSTYLGWTAAPVANANNTQLYRISHPQGAPQAYSAQRVDTSAPTCGGIPRGNWIYSRDTSGGTEGGSSGSPVLNSSGQVVGQLTGACGSNTGNSCDSTNNATIDGALAAYFSSVSAWLDPAPGGGSCHSGSNGSASYCSASCPCDDGEGDCDSDAECGAGLECVDNVGPNYGFASWVDVCEPTNCHSGAPGSASYCSASCPCDDGEGDCDSDSECSAGTECVDNVGPNYGFASWVDVCETSGGGSNPNSCAGNCGAQAPGGCWCDSSCASFGDCCSDKVAVCG